MGLDLQLQFQQGFGFWATLFSFLVGCSLLLYIYICFPQNSLVRLYLLLGLSGLLWQLNDLLTHISGNMATASFFDRLTSMGWNFIGPLCLHFVWYYTRFFQRHRAHYLLVLLYLPSFFLLSLYQMDVYPHVFHYVHSWGWVKDISKPWVSVLQLSWISLLVFMASWQMIRYTRSVKYHPLQFKQSLLITIAVGMPAFAGVTVQFIIPILFHTPSYPVTSSFMTVSVFCTFVALRKYQLFQPKDLVEEDLVMSEVPVLVCCIMPNGYAAYLNNYGEYILGISSAVSTSQQYHQLFKTTDIRHLQQLMDAHQQALAGKECNLPDISLQTPSGVRQIHFAIRPLVNNGRIIATLWVGKDITDLRQMQVELMRKEYLLSEAQQLAHLGNWEWNLSDNRITWSDEMYRIYGCRFDEKITFKRFVEWMDDADRMRVKRLLKKAIASRKDFSFYHQTTIDARKKVIFVKGYFGQTRSGEVNRIYGIAQDVTDRIEKEKLLEKQNRELEKVNQELDRFIYSISHDLRSPIASMMGIVQLCEEETNPEANRHHFGMIRESLKRLDHFITDVMHYSNNARIPVNKSPIVWSELVKDVINSIPPIYQQDVEIHFEFAEQSDEFYSDTYRIKTILQKLLYNAILHKHPQRNKNEVFLLIRSDDQQCTMVIEDKGMGIDHNVQSRIFEMFYRANSKVPGSGLGLYIVKEMLNKLEGEITVHSEPGIGTRFTLTIPNQKNLVTT
ncbi:sensor histidine kinase [Thermoflavifilum thermophilum]|uniref:histidine kinase n=1 Tax=Thermoflavifilum thermophilum TaxID=1393122 RepID=A0A1I7NLG4_9BACT|nr:sensor histidine kinase [Thermoflavifilum thermophilum]SFV35495.1 Signal transduction histidine kinase [Thermoflavifilum thermophilum]